MTAPGIVCVHNVPSLHHNRIALLLIVMAYSVMFLLARSAFTTVMPFSVPTVQVRFDTVLVGDQLVFCVLPEVVI